MGRSVESRLEKLEESMPRGYRTFDRNGKPVIESDLPAREWLEWATALLQSRGRTAAKEELRRQLARSTGLDSARGFLYQLVSVLADGPVEGKRC